MPRLPTIVPTLLIGGLASSCLEQCAPAKVGMGVSRLTIRNVGAIVEAVTNDTTCGFASQGVLERPVIDGRAGSEGSITWRTDECYIEFPVDAPMVSEDCNGATTSATGVILVTAEKKIGGILTGDPNRPVIPGGPDAVTITIERAQFEDFEARKSTSDKYLTMERGAISAVMSPRLAVAASTGVCSIPTKHIGFTHVVYEPSRVHVTTKDRSFDVDVEYSDLTAAHGPYAGEENAISGEIAVWGRPQSIPVNGDTDGLDPDYVPEEFVSSFTCKEDLKAPIDFECKDVVGPRLAAAASRLTIRTFGRIAKLLDKDTTCGFSSPAVAGSAALMGDVGGLGSAVLTASSCAIDVPEGTIMQTDCNGVATKASGRIVVSGTKTVTGRLTGDPASPVVPMSDSPAELALTVESFDRFVIDEDEKSLEIRSGKLSGKLVPRVAADTSQSGACAYSTAIARFFQVRYDAPSEVVIRSPSGSFVTTIDGSDLEALNGSWGEHTNRLDGNITLSGERYLLPVTPEDAGLDPEFDPATFDASWQCGETLERPVRFDCDFTAPLAQGAAQLTIQTIGKLAKLLDANADCGFSSQGVLDGISITGDLGYPGATGRWTVASPCELRFAERTEIERDCNGKATYASGAVRLTGTKIVTGIHSGSAETPIIPTSRDPAAVTVSAAFEDFALWADPEVNRLRIRSGTLTGTVRPRVAQDLTTGACSISTPVAAFEDVEWQSADVVVVKGAKQFNLRLDRSDLRAQNGSNDGIVTNSLSGSMTVDGSPFTVPVAGPPTLDPDYDQGTFDRSFACIPNMRVPAKDEECNMKTVIGHGIARLLVLASGAIAGRVNGNDECGFENFWVKTDPSNVVGDPGDMGQLEWEIAGCEIAFDGNQPYETDCLLRDKFITGSFSTNAHRTVRGLRETQLLLFDSIVPVSPTSVDLELQAVTLSNFRTYEVDPGAFEVTRGISIPRGILSAMVHPVTGERADEPGRFDVSTPVAHFTSVRLDDADVTIEAGGKTFRAYVNEARIEAFNGSYQGTGVTNLLGGSIRIDGQDVALGGGLDPEYDQSVFDDRYACTPNLAGLVPPM
jgi:hypothetical protein